MSSFDVSKKSAMLSISLEKSVVKKILISNSSAWLSESLLGGVIDPRMSDQKE